jgi:hypothetical protein
MELKIPQDNTLKVGQGYNFYIHAFYIVTGNPADGKTSCNMWIYDPEGNVIYNYTSLYVIGAAGDNFHFSVDGSNFSTVGIYYYNVDCADDTIGGFASSVLEVTPTGTVLNSGESIIYILIFVVSLLIFTALLIAGIYLPSNNKSDELTGYIIAISNMKYVKIFCLAFAFLTASFISFFMWQLSLAYLYLSFLATLFQFIFWISIAVIAVGFPLMIYFLIANWVRDNQINDALMHGLHVK